MNPWWILLFVAILWPILTATFIRADQVGYEKRFGRPTRPLRSGLNFTRGPWPLWTVDKISKKAVAVDLLSSLFTSPGGATWKINPRVTVEPPDDPRRMMYEVEDPWGQLGGSMGDPIIAGLARRPDPATLLGDDAQEELRDSILAHVLQEARRFGLRVVGFQITEFTPHGATADSLLERFAAEQRGLGVVAEAKAEATALRLRREAVGDRAFSDLLWTNAAVNAPDGAVVVMGQNGRGQQGPFSMSDPTSTGLLAGIYRRVNRPGGARRLTDDRHKGGSKPS